MLKPKGGLRTVRGGKGDAAAAKVAASSPATIDGCAATPALAPGLTCSLDARSTADRIH